MEELLCWDMQSLLLCMQQPGSAVHLSHDKTPILAARQVCQLAGILKHHLGEPQHILLSTMGHGTRQDMACNAVLCQAYGVLTQHFCNDDTVSRGPVLKNMLNHEVSVLVPAEPCRVFQQLYDQLLRLRGVTMLDDALQDAASKAVSCCKGALALQLCQHELHVIWWHDLDALLKNMVGMG